MTVYAFANVTRPSGGGTLLANQPVQIDEVSWEMGAYYNQSHPYDVFKCFIRYSPFAFQREDLITDTVNIDPLTSALAAYRVVGLPRRFPDGHWELYMNRFAGSS